MLVESGIDGPVVICAGGGNNGGDGFVIARHLENRGCAVRVLLFCDPDRVRGDAAVNLHVLQAAGTPLSIYCGPLDEGEIDRRLAEADWIVDALLGTGTKGAAREPMAAVIRRINAAGKKVLAVDLPSGLDCDTGEAVGACVRADRTATFVARKIGFDAADSQRWTGEVHVIDIGVPRAMLERG